MTRTSKMKKQCQRPCAIRNLNEAAAPNATLGEGNSAHQLEACRQIQRHDYEMPIARACPTAPEMLLPVSNANGDHYCYGEIQEGHQDDREIYHPVVHEITSPGQHQDASYHTMPTAPCYVVPQDATSAPAEQGGYHSHQHFSSFYHQQPQQYNFPSDNHPDSIVVMQPQDYTIFAHESSKKDDVAANKAELKNAVFIIMAGFFCFPPLLLCMPCIFKDTTSKQVRRLSYGMAIFECALLLFFTGYIIATTR